MAAEKGDSDGSRRHQKSESQGQDGEFEDYGDEPDFSDPEDFVDDITEEGLSDICFEKTCTTRYIRRSICSVFCIFYHH